MNQEQEMVNMIGVGLIEPQDLVERVDDARAYLQARIDSLGNSINRLSRMIPGNYAKTEEQRCYEIARDDLMNVKAILEGTEGQE